MTLASGNIVAQVVTVGVSPVLTRVFDPRAFGAFAVASGVMAILGSMATGKYEQAVLIPEDDSESAALSLVGLLLAASVAAAVGLAVGVCELLDLIPSGWNALAWLLGPGVFAYGAFQVMNYSTNRSGSYELMATARVTQVLVACGIQLVLGVMIPALGATSLFIGLVIGYAASTVLLAKHIRWTDWLRQPRGVWREMATQAHLHREFPMFNMPNGLANVASRQAPNFLLAGFFGAPVAGQYALGSRLLSAPLSLLGTALSQVVFRATATRRHRHERLFPLVRSVYARMAFLAVGPFAVLALAAPNLFAIVFGAEWQTAGVYAQVLSPWMFLMFLNSPLVPVLIVIGLQRYLLRYESFLFVFRVAALIVGALLGDPLLAVVLFGIVGLSFNAVLMGSLQRSVYQADLSR